MGHAACLCLRSATCLKAQEVVYSLLFFGGLRGMPIGGKPIMSPGPAPFAGPLCGPATGMGIAPLRPSAYIWLSIGLSH